MSAYLIHRSRYFKQSCNERSYNAHYNAKLSRPSLLITINLISTYRL